MSTPPRASVVASSSRRALAASAAPQSASSSTTPARTPPEPPTSSRRHGHASASSPEHPLALEPRPRASRPRPRRAQDAEPRRVLVLTLRRHRADRGSELASVTTLSANCDVASRTEQYLHDVVPSCHLAKLFSAAVGEPPVPIFPPFPLHVFTLLRPAFVPRSSLCRDAAATLCHLSEPLDLRHRCCQSAEPAKRCRTPSLLLQLRLCQATTKL